MRWRCAKRDDLLFIRLPSSAGFQAIACQDQTDLAHTRNVIGQAAFAPPKSSLGRLPFVTLTSFDLQLIPETKTDNSILKDIDFTSWPNYTHHFCLLTNSFASFFSPVLNVAGSILVANDTRLYFRFLNNGPVCCLQQRENDPESLLVSVFHHNRSKWMIGKTPSGRVPNPRAAGFLRMA